MNLAARSLTCLALAVAAARGADTISFTRDIRPILSQHCFKCHGMDQQKGKLRLDDRAAATKPAKSDEIAIVPGKPDASELLRRVTSDDPDEVMPPPKEKKPLTPAQIETLRAWIASGAEYQAHWAYVKPARPAPPRDGNPIDAFILTRLETEKLTPSPEAPRATLIRRASLDLIGLPPTMDEVDAFVSDASPNAFEKVVDRLLASPRFGEKWARMWLDLARYGDSAGYQHDVEMPLWLYRDWVIGALNANMPFDCFTIEQLAGDLLPNATTQQRIATGFNRCATATLGADNDAEELRAQLMWDRVSTFGTTWLGASLECAQCHNHKFDPLTQRDYYSLFAYFNRAAPELTLYFGDHYYITGGVLELPISTEQRAKLDAVRDEIAREWDAIETKLADKQAGNVPPTIRRLLISKKEDRPPERIAYLFVDELNKGQKLPAAIEPHVERIKHLARDLDRLRAPRSLVMEESAEARVTHVLLRGNVKTPGDPVQPATPAVLHPLPKDALPDRLGLARWVVSCDNPLAARVMVNRWWAEFFGTGIVATPEDFGLQGELPTHPELLDWLAVEFMESGWDMKHVLKRIVMSATYRQSSRLTPELRERDPQNRLLARGPRARLDGETLRDNVLAISGLLRNELGGKPVESSEHRRSVYVRHQRGAPDATLATFDAPDRFACTAKRVRSNTPLQALTLMNEPVFIKAARALAACKDITKMFRFCLARDPRADELAELQRLTNGRDETQALFFAANVLLNLDETITKE